MVVTNQNLYSASYSALKTFLEGLSLDTKKRYRGNFIHASMPNINAKEFEGYPFIVLLIDLMENQPTFDGNISEKIFRTQISIYADDSTSVDIMSDKIVANLKDRAKLTDFYARKLDSSPISYIMDLKGKKILYRNIWLIFKTRL